MKPSPGAEECSREALEEKILATEKTITILREEIYCLRESLNNKAPILSIVPVELLTEIFACAVAREPTEWTPSRLIPMPITLGAVCKSWRRVAWASPRLWGSLRIDFSSEKEHNQQQLIEEWIARSRNHPLALRLHNTDESDESWEPSRDVVRTMLKTCTFWTAVAISGGPFNHLLTELKQLQATFPLLSNLSIHYEFYTQIPWAFSSAPVLRTVSLISEASSDVMYEINWCTVQHLDASFEVNSAVRVLQATCASLVTLQLELLDTEDDMIPANTAIISLPHLTSFIFTPWADATEFDPSRLLRLMNVPSLSSLEIIVHPNKSDPEQTIGSGIIDIVSRSHCRLTALKLFGLNLLERDLFRLFSHVPSLQRLSLLFPAFCEPPRLSDFLVNRLNPTFLPNEPTLLPRLTNFEYTGAISFQGTAMLSMLEARMEDAKRLPGVTQNAPLSPVCQLEAVRISYTNIKWCQKDPNAIWNFYRKLALLLSEGTDVQMCFRKPEELKW